ncbi:nucleotidyltransferase domain-containing protein [Pontiella sp.]|uniref:nucleotidyltransferase domain-containing protein n=1 Tax=Pontiella sp. TaxID=2837462 RepID=UPI003561B56E
MDTAQTIDELIRQIVELAHPLKVFLFGSAATGNMTEHSDIDLLIVMPEGTHRRQTAQHLYRNISNVKTAYDLVVATVSDLERHATDSGLVYRSALEEGKLLYAV